MPILSRSREAGATRDDSLAKLLAAVEDLLAGGGSYADLTVEQIAGRAGVARSTFYVHFKDRRELLIRLVEQLSEPLLSRLEELRQTEGPPNQDRLHEAIRGAVVFTREHTGVLRALTEAAAYDMEVKDYRDELRRRFIDAISERLETQQRQGNGLSLPPRAGAVALVAMVMESCLLQVSDGSGVDDEELAAALALIWWRAAYRG